MEKYFSKAEKAWKKMPRKERAKALGGVTTGYGVNSKWNDLTRKDRNVVINYLYEYPAIDGRYPRKPVF